MNPRLQAVYILSDVLIHKKSLTDAFSAHIKQKEEVNQQAFSKELCYGVLRFYNRLSFLADQLLEKKIKQKDGSLYILILIGLYQLLEMNIPEYAAVKETVAVPALLQRVWAKNFINAVLRNFLREKEGLLAKAQENPSIWYAHPQWMLAMIQHDWPQQWLKILENNNKKAPLTLRLNLMKVERENYLRKLAELGIVAQAHPWVSTAVVISSVVDVTALPGFAAGEISVQDASAQLAAALLSLQPKQYVLDACAAPGSKTTHMLELEPSLTVLALDHDPKRLLRVGENLQRLNVKAKCIAADAGELATWWDGRQFDRILLDTPCTASGVIRRHPDIKWLRQKEDVAKTAVLQAHLLQELWAVLQPGGLLVYSTCSIFKDENVRQLKKFIATQADCVEEKISGEWGIDQEIGKQILPDFENDGFYYACLRKK